jgi:hypothetical protein
VTHVFFSSFHYVDFNCTPAIVYTQYQTPPLATFTNFNPIKLTRDNYPVWLPQIVPHLKGRNLFRYVDGSIACSSPTVMSTKDGVSTTSPTPAFLHWSMHARSIASRSHQLNSFQKDVISCNQMCYVQRCMDYSRNSFHVSIEGAHYASALSIGNPQKRILLHCLLLSQVSNSL